MSSSAARPVHVSTTSFQARDLETIVAQCDATQLDAIELSAVAGNASLLRGRRYPSHILVHNYFPLASPPFVLNLASLDRKTLERSRSHCRAAIDLSHDLGGAVYAAHAGYAAELAPHVLGDPERQAALPADRFVDRDDAYATLVESSRLLTTYARERGVRFLIENHVLAPGAGERGAELLFAVDPSGMEQLVRDVAEEDFGLLLDVGHLKVSAATLGFDPISAAAALTPWIGALHLSENDAIADTHESFGDEAWFLPLLRTVPDASVTIELHDQPVEAIADVRATVARWL